MPPPPFRRQAEEAGQAYPRAACYVHRDVVALEHARPYRSGGWARPWGRALSDAPWAHGRPLHCGVPSPCVALPVCAPSPVTPDRSHEIFVSVPLSSTTLFGVPFPLPTPQGRRDSQLRTMPEREIRMLRKATPGHGGHFGKPY